MQQARRIRQDAAKFLGLLGFTVSDKDALLGFSLRSVTEFIRNATNQPEVPAGLHMAAVYRTAGEYLRAMLDSGQVTDEQMAAADEESAAVKQIKEGDTTVTYAVQDALTAAQRFDRLVQALLAAGAGQFAAHRRIRW